VRCARCGAEVGVNPRTGRPFSHTRVVPDEGRHKLPPDNNWSYFPKTTNAQHAEICE
jgi:hypothetical protein